MHGAKNSSNPNIHRNGIESFEGKKQHTVRHLSPNSRQQAEALTRFGGRFICQRLEVEFSRGDDFRSP